jgi:hypothetical protein
MLTLAIIAAIFTVVIYKYAFRPIIWIAWNITWSLIKFAIKVLIIGAAIIVVIYQAAAPGM